MKKVLLASVLTALLGACASGVNLDTPPVEDRAGTAVTPGAAGASQAASGQGSGVNSRDVAAVDLNKNPQDKTGPAGERIVYFDYDSFVVKSEYQGILDNQARYLKADKSRKAVIEGHTDERGGREYNLALGQKRAEAVRRALGLQGVADAQVDAVSFGKEKPAAQGNDEAAMAKNRRAEVTYRP
jgi:peptidoglycan-associated lipoprotein